MKANIYISGSKKETSNLQEIENHLAAGHKVDLEIDLQKLIEEGLHESFYDLYPKVWLEINVKLYSANIKKVKQKYTITTSERSSHKYKKIPIVKRELYINQKPAKAIDEKDITMGGVKSKKSTFDLHPGNILQLITTIDGIERPKETSKVIYIKGIGLCLQFF